jgi:hypothetical protein
VTCLDLLSASESAQQILQQWQLGVYTGMSGHLVADIGKAWKSEMNIVMKHNTKRGVTWFRK